MPAAVASVSLRNLERVHAGDVLVDQVDVSADIIPVAGCVVVGASSGAGRRWCSRPGA